MLDRIRGFRERIEDGVAERAVPFEHGVGLFVDSLPDVYDLNFVRVREVVSADVHVREADALMERNRHRQVMTEGADEDLEAAFRDLGWVTSTHVVMLHTRPPDRIVDTSIVREVTLDDIAVPHRATTLSEPYGSPALAEQLLDAKRRSGAVVDTRYFGIEAGGGLAAYCELMSDGATAQIEDVNTLAEHRGRGFGRAVVQRAIDEARARHDAVFLEALADDWPRELYARLGFDEIGRRQLHLRPPHPLTRLTVRTPRLELRLATVAELRELARVALDGIHDPVFMPFEQAWTDTLTEESFLEWHATALRDWRPYDWRLELVAFHEGRPIGDQSLRAKRFGAERVAHTGSWLGRAWQGRGFGTEMRSGVLTLLFDALGGLEAHSGAIEGNEASLAVSRKLGYAETGFSTLAPRGVPVRRHDLVLPRDRFRRLVPVALSGVEGLEPLIGLEPLT